MRARDAGKRCGHFTHRVGDVISRLASRAFREARLSGGDVVFNRAKKRPAEQAVLFEISTVRNQHRSQAAPFENGTVQIWS
jgi:hypothetical protein